MKAPWRSLQVIVLGSASLLALTTHALGQAAPPFIGDGATAFDPEIGYVNSGALLDAQVVVSEDRKYVTLNMGVQNASLIALNSIPAGGFAVAGGNLSVNNTGPAGFVGGVNPRGGNAAEPFRGKPIVVDKNNWGGSTPVLERRGMFLLAPR